MEVNLSPGDLVLDEEPAHLPKRGRSPPLSKFSAHVYCGQTAAWIKMPLGTEVGLGSDDIVLHEDPAPTPHKRGHSPQFSAHFYCAQTAGCIKMPLGLQVGLSPDNFVVDGDPAAPRLRDTVLDGDLPKIPLGMEVFLGPGDFVFNGDPATPRKKANSWMHQDATWYVGRYEPRQFLW